MASAEALFSRYYSSCRTPKENSNTSGGTVSDAISYPVTMSSSVPESTTELTTNEQKDMSQVRCFHFTKIVSAVCVYLVLVQIHSMNVCVTLCVHVYVGSRNKNDQLTYVV